MKKLSERLAVLEEMGFDTSKYNVEIKGNSIELTGVAKTVVEDKQIDNKKLFRRWVAAQTFRMLYEPTWDYDTGRLEIGWDNYLRNRYSYKYQFDMMLEELKVLNKLECRDKEEFAERSRFFDKDVVVATCEHYMSKLETYAKSKLNSKASKVKLSKYGEVDLNKYSKIVADLYSIIKDMKSADRYAELYTHLKRFMNKMSKVPNKTPKCSAWKTAFKGSGAYYTLKNLILFHDCLLNGCVTKQESMDKLTKCLDDYKGNYWKFHYMLLNTIELNKFDLRESIKRNK